MGPNYNIYTDEQLLALLSAGDEAAFAELYQRYWDKLLYKAGSKLRSIQAAEEILQDIFLDLWKRRETLLITTTFNTYISAALKFKIINYQAAEHRRSQRLAQHLSVAGHSANSAYDILQEKELQARLDQLVLKLPERCRLIYRLKQEGYTQQQISHRLSISPSTVQTQIERAMRNLRVGLSNFLSSFL